VIDLERLVSKVRVSDYNGITATARGRE